jgi:hypothetical protein
VQRQHLLLLPLQPALPTPALALPLQAGRGVGRRLLRPAAAAIP